MMLDQVDIYPRTIREQSQTPREHEYKCWFKTILAKLRIRLSAQLQFASCQTTSALPGYHTRLHYSYVHLSVISS